MAFLDETGLEALWDDVVKFVGEEVVPDDGSITTAKLADGAVTDAKLAQSGGVLEKVDDLESAIDTKAPAIIETASGAIASFDDGADDMPVKKLVASIEPVQDLHGYDSPWPAGGGKQLFDKDNPTVLDDAYFNDLTLANGGGNKGIVVPCEPSTTYTVSLQVKNYGDINIGSFTSMPAIGSTATAKANAISDFTGKVVTLTTGANDAYLFVKYNNTNQTQTYTNQQVLDGLMVEVGSAASSYVPYSNICPISGWTWAEIERTGVNVWDEEWELGSINATTGQPFYSEIRIRSKNFCPCLPTTTYYIKSPDVFRVLFYDRNKTYLGYLSNMKDMTFTSLNDAYFFKISSINDTTAYNNDISINYPATDTEYHSYTGNQISVTFPDEAGTVYCGELTINDDGAGTLVVNGIKDVLTVANGMLQSEFFTESSVQTVSVLGDNVRISLNRKSQSSNMNTASNTYQHIMANLCPHQFSYAADSAHWYINGQLYLFLPVSDVGESLESFKNYLATNPFEVYVQFSTPIEYTLTASQVSTIYGTNNIWADTGNVEVAYPADTKLYIDNKITQAIANALNS